MLQSMTRSEPIVETPAPVALAALAEQLDAAVDGSRTQGDVQGLERLLTDGYGEVLRLETVRRQAHREFEAGLQAVAEETGGLRAASALHERLVELAVRIHDLRAVLDAAVRRSRLQTV